MDIKFHLMKFSSTAAYYEKVSEKLSTCFTKGQVNLTMFLFTLMKLVQ